jgi:hypothetical protein
MPKYIVEQLMTYRNVYVVEADNETQAIKVAENADDNWQKFLGTTTIDINEYTEERIAYFKQKEYFWDGCSYIDSEGFLAYRYPNGDTNEPKEIFVK